MTAPLDIIRVICKMALAGQEILNVYHTVSTGAHSDEDAVTDVLVAIDTVYDLIDGSMVNDLTFESVTLLNVTGGYDLGEYDWFSMTAGGETSAEYLPTGVAALITLPTAQLRTRGRKFFAGMGEGSQADSLWSGALVTVLTAVGTALSETYLGDASGDPYSWGVVDGAGQFWPHQSAIISNIPSYQRRRKVGVGS